MIDQKRNHAMDLVRCAALFCVVGIHFFAYAGFYDETVQGPEMLILTVLRSAFLICVPLFIVLSGCLMRTKTPSRQYYRKLGKTLWLYLLASICCILFKWTYLKETVSVPRAVFDILEFSAAPYGWYVEMYIGLYLLIPYFNILYRNIGSQKHKQVLLLVLLLLTAAPGVVNIYYPLDVRWWITPSSQDAYYKLIPDWWSALYPLTYYFIGCYLSEYPLKLRRGANVCWLLLVWIVNGLFQYYRSYGTVFIRGEWQDWGALPNVLQTVLAFHLLSGVKLDRCSLRMRKWLCNLSNWCFGAYLVSWIFDRIFYWLLMDRQPDTMLRLKYFLMIVPAVCVCSFALSAVLNKLYSTAVSIRKPVKTHK